jgi:predicted aspartyl protease
MERIQLNLYDDPGQVEVFINLKQKDGGIYRIAALIDTGAAVSLLPSRLMDFIEYRVVNERAIKIEQAGIARQSFKAIEAYVYLSLEDATGARTQEAEVLVWFAQTRATLIGFKEVLDRAVLHIDMLNRSGWIEMD